MAGVEDIGRDLLEPRIRVFLGKGGAVDVTELGAAQGVVDGIHASRVNRQIIDKEAIRAPRGFFEVVVAAGNRSGAEF